MGWPHEAFLYLRQITTPKSRPANGGNLLYTKSDNNLYLMNADGTEHAVSSGGGTVTRKTATFKFSTSPLAVGTGATRFYNDTGSTLTIASVRASVETAPSGGSVVIDVNKNGTTIFTTQANRPTIATTALTSGKVTAIDVTSFADGDYLTVDIDTYTSPAAQLTVEVTLG